MRKLSFIVLTVLLWAALPLAGRAQEGQTWRVLDPPRYEATLPDAPAPSDFWNLLLHEDTPPRRGLELAASVPDQGPYRSETVFNEDNYTLTFKLCGFTPEVPLEPLATLPDGSPYNSAATLSRLGLWLEPEALPEDDPDATCLLVVQQIGLGSFLGGEYAVTYVDPEYGVFTHTWSLDAPRFQTVVNSPRGLDYDAVTQAAWLLLSFPPEETLRVGVYHRFDTVEPAEGQTDPENPIGWFQFVGEAELETDEFGEAALVVTVPEALRETVAPENLVLIIWNEQTGFWGHNYFPDGSVARILVGEERTLPLRQARQPDAPELIRLPNNGVIEIISQSGDQLRVRTLNGLEGWVYDDWVMPLFGVEAAPGS